MSRFQEKILLAFVDFIAINLGTMLLLWTKHVGGVLHSAGRAWLHMHGAGSSPSFVFVIEFYGLALGLIYVLWLILFISFGLYRTPRINSRFDEVTTVLKVITVGTVLFMIATLDSGFSFTRALMGMYWLLLFGLVAGGRFALTSVQKYLVVSGIGRRRAVIVGSDVRGMHEAG